MAKTKKWTDLKNATMSKESQDRAREMTWAMIGLLPLAQVRKARELTQEQLAETLEMPQGNISKLERRVDMYVSTLRRYIEAMGGELVVIARFPDADLRIELFETAGELEPRARASSAVESEREMAGHR